MLPQINLGDPTQDLLHAYLIMSMNFSPCNQHELNLQGMGPRFVEVESVKEIGLWSEIVEGKEKEAGMRSFRRKEVLTKNRSSMSAMYPTPILLLFQVYFPFFNGGSSKYNSEIKSYMFSP